MRLYGEIIPSFSEGIIDRTGAQIMLYLTCTMISSVHRAHYGESCAVDCGTIQHTVVKNSFAFSYGSLVQIWAVRAVGVQTGSTGISDICSDPFVRQQNNAIKQQKTKKKQFSI